MQPACLFIGSTSEVCRTTTAPILRTILTFGRPGNVIRPILCLPLFRLVMLTCSASYRGSPNTASFALPARARDWRSLCWASLQRLIRLCSGFGMLCSCRF